MQQRKLVFAENVRQQIVNYHESPKQESRTAGAQVKLTPTQKQALTSICKENGIGVSTFIAEALDVWIELYPHKNKLTRHRDTLLSLLQNLS